MIKTNNMDIQLKKKPWIIRKKYYILGGVVLVAVLAYSIVLQFQPDRRRISSEASLGIARVEMQDFCEYVEQEGIVQPMITLKVNTRMAGFVDRIVAEEGAFLEKGDTILVLSDPEMMDELAAKEYELHKQMMTYREQEIAAAQQSISLRKQVLQNTYELDRIAETYALSQEEYRMGVKSKAELEVARKEYEYKVAMGRMERESLAQDSVAAEIRRSLIAANRQQDMRLYEQKLARRSLMAVCAPISGQLSSLQAELGQQIGSGAAIGEIKDLTNYKVGITLGEYYIDRVLSGLPATARYRGRDYPMKVRRVVPEIVNRSFSADLVFAEGKPDAIRIGQSISTQVQLGGSERTLIIPRGDFYATTGGQWIFRVVPGERRAQRVSIRLGRQNPKHYEVVEGLQEGDQVITAGYSRFGEAEEVTW